MVPPSLSFSFFYFLFFIFFNHIPLLQMSVSHRDVTTFCPLTLYWFVPWNPFPDPEDHCSLDLPFAFTENPFREGHTKMFEWLRKL
ncbi:hypothetical protein BDV25DRAFT_166050, partial [Aspergillus avenaceus]